MSKRFINLKKMMYGTRKEHERETQTDQKIEGERRVPSGGTDYRTDAGSKQERPESGRAGGQRN